MNNFGKWVVNYSVDHYWIITFVAIICVLTAGAFFPLVVMDTDPENMLEKKEPARVVHNETKEEFNLSDTIVVGIINNRNEDGVFNPESLERIYSLTQFAKTLRWRDEKDLNRYSGVVEADIIAPSVTEHMSQNGKGSIKFEWLMPKPPKSREEALSIRDKALSNPLLKDMMVSSDGKALSIFLPLTDKSLSYKVYTELRNKIDSFDGDDEFHIAGLPVAEGAIGVEMFTQMGTASPLAMAVIIILLFVFFKKWQLIILPMIISTASITIAMGAMIAFGYPVHILSSMLPMFLMSIAMVDSVHVISEFFDIYTKKKGRKETIKEVMETLFMPMLYTSLTTAAGFLSLVLAPIPPARVFGVFLAVGVMAAWVLTVVFVPAYIMLIPEKKLNNFGLSMHEIESRGLLTSIMKAFGNFTYKNAKMIVLVMTMLICVAVYGISTIRINDNYAKRFTENHPIRKADVALSGHFGGIYTAYIVLDANEEKQVISSEQVEVFKKNLTLFAMKSLTEIDDASELIKHLNQEIERKIVVRQGLTRTQFYALVNELLDDLQVNCTEDHFFAFEEIIGYLNIQKERMKLFKNPETLKYISGLQEHLSSTGVIGKSISVADIIKKVNQELIDGKPHNYRIPGSIKKVGEGYMQYQQSHRPNDLWHFVTPDFMHATIQVQFKSGDSTEIKRVVKSVDDYFKNNIPPSAIKHRWAGLHYINLVLEDRLVWGFLKSLAGSFLIVFIMMSIMFRSVIWGTLCMIPLSVTLIIIYGVTGLIGKDYDLPIAVLSALSIGMAVDFAIHFLERSRNIYKKHSDWKKVYPLLFGEPARAISRNAIVIAIGFLPLLIASLIPYKTTGIMLFAILSLSGCVTLLVLPAIIALTKKWLFKH